MVGLMTFGALVWSVAMLSTVADAQVEPSPATPEMHQQGPSLFRIHCSSCHGAGGGAAGRGPDISDEGAAAVDFVLRTGRMPMADPGHETTRGPVRFDEDQIEALVAYVGSLGDGPAVPEVDTAGADITNGGNLFRLNCAACHVASGSGAIIGGGYTAPNLMQASPTEVGEAVIVGPGAMPVFSDLTTQEVNDIAAYVQSLRAQNTTDLRHLGGIGPVAEGLAAWLIATVVLVGLTRWIGTSRLGTHPNETNRSEDPK